MVKKTIDAAEDMILLCPNVLRDQKSLTILALSAIAGSVFGFFLGVVIHI